LLECRRPHEEKTASLRAVAESKLVTKGLTLAQVPGRLEVSIRQAGGSLADLAFPETSLGRVGKDFPADSNPVQHNNMRAASQLRAAGKGNSTTAKLQGAGSSEADVIEQAKQGDALAFETLYNLHKRRVYSLCLRMTANTAEAEDLTQEAFLQLFRKIGTFRGESAFSTWLHRMAVNVVLMRLRKKGLPVIPLDDPSESEEETARKEPGAPDIALAGSVDRLELQRAVESLPPGYRTIFVLHDVEGYEHNEIAGLVGCSIGNSKSQLHKARMKLRELLKTSRAEKAIKP